MQNLLRKCYEKILLLTSIIFRGDYQAGEKVVHREIKADPQVLLDLLEPYIGNVIVGVECMHCWYWVSDICEDNGIDFILGHALYMKAIHGGKTKNDKIDSYKIAMLMRGGTFPLAYVFIQKKCVLHATYSVAVVN